MRAKSRPSHIMHQLIWASILVRASTAQLTQLAEVVGPVGSRFGTAVALSGNGRFGLFGVSGNGSDPGSAELYSSVGASPFLDVQVTGYSTGTTPFGSVSLSADGTVMAIGDPISNSVRVLRRGRTAAWSSLGSPLVGSSGSQYGFNADLSSDGQVLAICGVSTTNSFVDVFRYNVSARSWLAMGSRLIGSGRWAVAHLSADGNTVVIGYPRLRSPAPPGVAIQIFGYTESTESWSLVSSVGSVEGVRFFESLAISHNAKVVVAAQFVGFLQVFNCTVSPCVRLGSGISDNVDATGTTALTCDGRRLVVLTRPNSTAFEVRVYDYSDSTQGWALFDTLAYSTSSPMSATLALSSNGSRCLLGMPGADTVRIIEIGAPPQAILCDAVTPSPTAVPTTVSTRPTMSPTHQPSLVQATIPVLAPTLSPTEEQSSSQAVSDTGATIILVSAVFFTVVVHCSLGAVCLARRRRQRDAHLSQNFLGPKSDKVSQNLHVLIARNNTDGLDESLSNLECEEEPRSDKQDGTSFHRQPDDVYIETVVDDTTTHYHDKVRLMI